ncbi:arabidopsis phospholipase-like protein [Striga asiatica]|uniref:Arabidopsis phospholipase-like protein n=1 Tax=Striga asiatica TaxID=4170 RepID=A0A5A7QQ95_STRAF|nr:arabidopsis phospholipase-like protein [Striga asiatica]
MAGKGRGSRRPRKGKALPLPAENSQGSITIDDSADEMLLDGAKAPTFEFVADFSPFSRPSRYPTRYSTKALARFTSLHAPVKNSVRNVNRKTRHLSSLDTELNVLNKTHEKRLSGNEHNVAPKRPCEDQVFAFSQRSIRSSLRKPIRNVSRATRASSILNPEVPILNETHQESPPRNEDNAMPELNCTSQPSHEDLDSHTPAGSPTQPSPVNYSPQHYLTDNTKTNIDNKSISAGASIDCKHSSIHVDKFILANEISIEEKKGSPEKSTASNNRSFNVTEFARRLHDDAEDDPEEEVESPIEPGFELVHGHKVKTETVPLVERIFEKHGDITSGTHMESPISISNSLEQLCGVCGRLEKSRFVELTLAELDAMLADVRDMERAGLRIEWLRERLEFVSRAWTDYNQYFRLKELVKEYDVSIGGLEKELDAWREQHLEMGRKISGLEDELAAKRERSEVVRSAVVSTRSRVKSLVSKNLVDGLL